MNLNLSKPICFFDLETTGINISKDRIVEISILKVYPNQKQESFTWLVNPQINIPDEVVQIHGISNERVKNSPSFKDLSKQIHQIISGSDLAGFNSNRFDIPLLAEEMLRSDINFNLEGTKFVDIQTIFHKMEKRNLSAAYKFYCNKNLQDAHSAKADTLATYEVLKAQIDKYDSLENNTTFLSEFSTRNKFADLAGFIHLDKENNEYFSFGKHKGKLVREVLENDSGYFNWILNADFPLYTKRVLKSIKLSKLNNKLL